MPVYLDHNATCPVDERVLEAMLPYLGARYGNPSSVHSWGKEARTAIDNAREQVAELISSHPSQVIFTSGGTEANNYALKGFVARQSPGHILVSSIEHASVLEVASLLERQGWQVDYIPVDEQGIVNKDILAELITENTRLVSVMMANNETGAIQDIDGICQIAHERNAVFHTDAVQACGKTEISFSSSHTDMMTLSGHKIYAAKGIGALIVNKAIDMEPLLHGGSHEKGRRAGTENVAAIVGFGKAAELAKTEISERKSHMLDLRDKLENGLRKIPDVTIFSEHVNRLPNTVFFGVPGIDGETLLMNLDTAGFAVGSGSACSSEEPESSHVLTAMGVNKDLGRSAIRASVGKDNTQQDIEAFISALEKQVNALRSMAVSVMAS